MRTQHWIALGLALASFALYAQVRNHDFVDYDDTKHIVLNPDVQAGLGPASVWKVFTEPHYGDFVPLTYVSLQLDRTLYGPGASGVLLTNAALHAASAALFFLTLFGMTGSLWRSAAAAALFAAHPLRVESVAWAFERKDVLCGFFFVLGLWAYSAQLRAPGVAKRAAVAACLVAALLAKPMALSFPFALLLLDYWPLGRLQDPGQVWPRASRLRQALVDKALLFAIALAWLAWTLGVHGSSASVPEATRLPFDLRLAKAVESIGFYWTKTFWPTDLAVFYPHDFGSVSRGGFVGSLALLLGATAAALALARRQPAVITGWLWFLGTLVPASGLVQLGMHVRADRYTYLPHLGLGFALVWGLASFWPASRGARRGLALLGAAVVLVLAALSERQIGVWRDTQSLFSHAVAVTDANFVAHWRLGVALAQEGRRSEAIEHLEASVEAFPDLAVSRFELAQTLEEAGRSEAAFGHYDAVLRLEPGHSAAARRYGIALAGRGEFDRARELLERSLRVDPAQPKAHAALAAALESQQEIEPAVTHYRRALELDPDFLVALNNLANLLATGPDRSLRQPDEALRLALAAERLSGGAEPAVLDTLARAHAAVGDRSSALQVAERALELARDRGDAALVGVIRITLEDLGKVEPETEE